MSANDIEQNCVEGNLYKLWVDNGIVYCKYYEGLIIDLDIAKHMIESRLTLSKGKKMLGLVDARESFYLLQSAKKFMASKYAYSGLIAGGVLLNNPVTRILVNSFLNLPKTTPVPIRVFTKEETAKQWLYSFK